MLHFIKLDNYSSTPKYQQIYNSITQGIEDGNIEAGSRLPSIPEICSNFDIAKKTVEKAYRMLKEKNVIKAVHGKGHYVRTSQVQQRRRIFLIFNKLSRHKKIIYDHFVKEMGEDVAIDFYVYHNELALFREMLTNPNHHVVYSGMPLDAFVGASPPENWRALAGVAEGTPKPPIILMLAALEPRKRHRELIEVFGRVVDRFPEVRLLCAGDGPARLDGVELEDAHDPLPRGQVAEVGEEAAR